MKIWVIGRNYPVTSNRMQGSFEMEQAKMLSKFGNDVTYLACSAHPYKVIQKLGFQNWTDGSVTVCTFSAIFAPRIYPFYMTKIRNLFWKTLFQKTIKQYGLPDVIHVHYPAMMMIGDLLSEFSKQGVRIVATEHWTRVQSGRLDGIEKKEYQKTLAALDACICVGTDLKTAIHKLNALPDEKLHIVPNVLNSSFTPRKDHSDSYQFVAVGRLVPNKMFGLLIEAFAERFSNQNVRLVIIGNGPEYETLCQAVQAHNLDNKVILKGMLTREQTARIVAESDCLCCPSVLETFGVPVIEGWACGLPVVATSDIPVMKQYYHDFLGLTVHPNDLADLSQAMEAVYQAKDSVDHQRISNFAKENFSEEAVCKSLMEIYRKLAPMQVESSASVDAAEIR